jgi:alpha-1,6-mannosyltransferase
MGAIEVKARAPGAGLRLVTVTRLVEGYKNLELLFRAVSVLADSGTVCRLTVIGDGPRRPALEQKARLLGVGRLVEFAGRVQDSEMERLLCESHLGLFPSRDSLAEGGFEGFGLVVHELASAGLPVLVGRAAGAVDAADPAWAILLDPDDLRSWVRAVENIAADEPGRLRMARSALAWAQTVDHRATARRFLEAMRL